MPNIDYLTEDNILPKDQKFVCVSFLSNKKIKSDNKEDKNENQSSNIVGVKIRGVFSTYESACDHAKTLRNIDDAFDIFVGDMGKWLAFDPEPDTSKDSEYANQELNNMMKSYLENQEKAKIFHEQRKNELQKQSILENLNSRNENLNELKEKVKNSDNENEINNLNNNIKSIEDKMKEDNDHKEKLEKQLEELDKKIKLYTNKNIKAPKIPKVIEKD